MVIVLNEYIIVPIISTLMPVCMKIQISALLCDALTVPDFFLEPFSPIGNTQDFLRIVFPMLMMEISAFGRAIYCKGFVVKTA